MPALLIALGALTFAAGAALLGLDVPRWSALWLPLAVTGLLLVFDGLIGLAGRVPFTVGRRRELLAMLAFSVPLWWFFEAYNALTPTWHYTLAPRTGAAQLAVATLTAATVLPSVLLPPEVLRAWGAFDTLKWNPKRLPVAAEVALGVAGVSCLVLPVALPFPAFWLVLGAPILVPAVVARRIGAPSLLTDLEEGRPAPLLRLLSGGLFAGLVWEVVNRVARTQWISTAPLVETLTPIDGALGGAALAVGGASSFALWCHFVGLGPAPERALTTRSEAITRRDRGVAIALFAVFVLGAWLLPVRGAVRSVRPLLSEVTLARAEVQRLDAAGIDSPERLVAAVRRQGLDAVAERVPIRADRLTRAMQVSTLALHQGMGAPVAQALLDAGVQDTDDLAWADADTLLPALERRLRLHRQPPPTPAELRVWIRAAQRDARR